MKAAKQNTGGSRSPPSCPNSLTYVFGSVPIALGDQVFHQHSYSVTPPEPGPERMRWAFGIPQSRYSGMRRGGRWGPPPCRAVLKYLPSMQTHGEGPERHGPAGWVREELPE